MEMGWCVSRRERGEVLPGGLDSVNGKMNAALLNYTEIFQPGPH